VEVTVAPLDPTSAPGYYLVSFAEHDAPERPASPADAPAGGAASADVRHELGRVREELQSTIEELQTSNEELKASNEEITSVNEELQSTNEELETSKEELQSLNEELTTVNAQLQTKMEELEASTNDLGSLLSSTDIAVLFLDRNLAIRRYTPAVKDLFELIPGDTGRPLSDLARKFEDPRLSDDARLVLDKLVPIEREVKSASGRWYVRRVLPYRTADNRITGVVVTFVDVSALKGAEAALGQSEDLYRLVFQGIREYAVIVLDLENRIRSWNTGAEETLGYAEGEALGMRADVIFTPEDRGAGAVEQELSTARSRGRAMDERWHVRRDGSRFWGSGITSALYDANGSLRGYVKVMRDNTERKRTEEALRATKAAAEAANEEKDQFLAMVSHELRTPLSAVLLWAKLLRGPGGAGQMAEGLEAIEQGAEAQRQLIDDLLDSTRITAGKLRLNLRRIELGDVVRAAVESARPTAVVKELELHLDVAADVGHVVADPDRLQQVIWNLLTNAMKFTPQGGRIDVTVRRLAGEVEIGVADNGRGIAADFLPRLFDRFSQADSGPSRPQGGLGIGLTIAQKLAELHGGVIRAASAGEGKGATFTVRLPLPSVPCDKADDRSAAEHGAAATATLAGARVLLVEDDGAMRAAIARLLGVAGADVTVAASGAEALAALAAPGGRPDLIVADVGMPGMDGYELMRRIRADEAAAKAPPVPAVALTAFARDVDRKRARQAGFQRHIAKPPDPDAMILELARLVAEARRRGSGGGGAAPADA
jgi:two-component system CheB/CheR fusion protein